MEYPGRYSRWHMGYVDPCLEFVARGRRISVKASTNGAGVLLPAVSAAMETAGEATFSADGVVIDVLETDEVTTEEERSRRPTVFTALRAVVELFRCDDPHLGLYGAFGYDLAFQFEPIRMRVPRPDDQRDLVLHLADDMIVVDRKRETSARMTYEFTVGGVSTEGLPRRHRADAADLDPRAAAAAGSWRIRRGGQGRQGEVRPRGPVRGRAGPRHVPGL